MIALRSLASAAANIIYDAINAAETPDQLDQVARTMWRGCGEGVIGDDDAQFLQSCIDRRRPLARSTAPEYAKPVGKLVGRLGSRFMPRQRPRSPDRKASRNRRRMLGGSSVLPANLRHHYTEGQRSVLCIVAGEVKHHGVCDLRIDIVAALAGVCRTTVQTTMHEAHRLAHIKITERPQHGRKNLPNVVEIISAEWCTWLRRGPAAHRPMPIGSNSSITFKMVSTTKSTDSKARNFGRGKGQRAVRTMPWGRSKSNDAMRERGQRTQLKALKRHHGKDPRRQDDKIDDARAAVQAMGEGLTIQAMNRRAGGQEENSTSARRPARR